MSFSKELYAEVEQLERRALEGEVSELQACIEMKELEEYVELCKKNVGKAAMRVINLEKDSKTEYAGYVFSVQSKKTWKYDHIQVWKEKKNELESIEEKAKAAYLLSQDQFGNAIENFEGIASADTGEVIETAICQYSEPFIKIDKLKTKENGK